MEGGRIESGTAGHQAQHSSESKSPSPTASASSSADNIEIDTGGKAPRESCTADQSNTGPRGLKDGGGGGGAGVPGG